MSDPVHKVDKSQIPPEATQNVKPAEFKEEEKDQPNFSPLEKELITKYHFSPKEANTFNNNFIQQSMRAMKEDLDRMTKSIKEMFKEDQG